MEKEKVLVRDNKGAFLKMFKRKFKEEFEFNENPSLINTKEEPSDFDRCIYVVYDNVEFIDFLKLDKKGTNVLVYLFNEKLYNSVSFLEELGNLMLLDGSKAKTEIIKDLKAYFNQKNDFDEPVLPNGIFQNLRHYNQN
ncbi:hypothetical protein [Flavobacterium sp. DG2-3]|uniref:hypothetical protein n=1 Tax=Flavobacterium sp. DG2-3 TaxID=3068317 RepID=UPI00273E60FD|nr:hypothetical protein [Flavobacterium sp. DG2-3]MDP5199130.1 hypothetical protein [Flavobacterium sp. DG2-3]